MNIVVAILGIFGIGITSQTRLNAVLLGQSISVPVLWLVAAIVALLMLAAVLMLARLLIRDGLRLRPGVPA